MADLKGSVKPTEFFTPRESRCNRTRTVHKTQLPCCLHVLIKATGYVAHIFFHLVYNMCLVHHHQLSEIIHVSNNAVHRTVSRGSWEGGGIPS